ncbi:MAG: hypothetical protein ACXABY_13020 [Candidatus Thorarchaeota archaeon]|jgi:hypothetical protein
MALGALVGAGTSILGGIMGRKSGKRLSAALREATQFQREQAAITRGELDPFRSVATAGAGEFAGMAGAESPLARARRMAGEVSPEFQQLQQDFLEQANREAAARGQFFSPRAFQEIQSRGLQRLGTAESAAQFQRNLALSQMGLQAAGMGGQLGQAAAGGVAGLAAQTPVNVGMQTGLLGAGQALQQGLANQRFQNLFSQFLGGGGGGMGAGGLGQGAFNLGMPGIGGFGAAARGGFR